MLNNTEVELCLVVAVVVVVGVGIAVASGYAFTHVLDQRQLSENSII